MEDAPVRKGKYKNNDRVYFFDRRHKEPRCVTRPLAMNRDPVYAPFGSAWSTRGLDYCCNPVLGVTAWKKALRQKEARKRRWWKIQPQEDYF